MSTTKKAVFWVTSKIQSYQKVYAAELAELGYDTEFFVKIEQLEAALAEHRASMILFSDYGDEVTAEDMLLKFLSLPDVMGAKLILDSYNGYKSIRNLCLSSAFRDIIPSKMITKEWVERFKYSTSSKAKYSAAPNLMLTVNMKAAASVPAKITKFGPGYMRIETRMEPEIGTQIGLSGKIIKSLGEKLLKVKVTKLEHTRLSYRFSGALDVTWNVNDVKVNKLTALIAKLQRASQVKKHRVFLIASNSQIRSEVFRQLKGQGHEIRTAISINSMVNDPKFYTPNLVVAEAAFAEQENSTAFSEMCRGLEYGTAVVIVGPCSHLEYYQNKFKKIVITSVDQNVKNQVENWLSLVSTNNTNLPNVYDVPYNHDLSSVSFLVPARVTKLHPKMGEIKFPLRVGDFGLVGLGVKSLSKINGQKPIIKLASYNLLPARKNKDGKESFNHASVFYFADIGLVNRIKLNQWMAEKFYEELEKHGGTYSKFEKAQVEIEEAGTENQSTSTAEESSNVDFSSAQKIAKDKNISKAYAEHMIKRKASHIDDPYVHKPLAKKGPKYVTFLDMEVPAKQYYLVKNTLIVILAIIGMALFFNYVAQPRLTEVGAGYSDQFTKFRKYFGEQRSEFEKKRVESGKSENLMGDDVEE